MLLTEMGLGALLLFCSLLGVFQKGLTDLIRTQQTVIAAVGDEVLLNCQLLQHEDVVKVIWWKILIKGMKNLISYHKKYGQDVNPALKDKIGFTDAGLQNSSIFIRNVTEEDEGCYLCLFNIHPGDDLEATTCLQVYGFHEDSGIEITHITIITPLSVVLVFCFVAAVITVLLIRRQRNSRRQRDSEEFKMSPKITEHTPETNTPDNENLRKRMPPEKREGSESIEPSPETRRKLF